MDATQAEQAPALVRWLANGRGDALRHLGWTQLVRRIADRLRTDIARARVHDDLEAMERLLGLAPASEQPGSARQLAAVERLPALRPETERAAAAARLSELEGIEALWLFDNPSGGAGIAAALSQLEDLDESLAVARGGGLLSVVELIGVAELCRACGLLAEAFAQAERREASGALGEGQVRGLRACAARLGSRPGSSPIETCAALLAELDRAIDRRPEVAQISADASPALAAARREVRAAKQRLQTNAERLLRNPVIAECLRDSYLTERDGRVVLPVRSDRLGAVRERGAIIHGSSSTGQTFYLEPASLVEDNNALREAELAAVEEERKILRALSTKVAERATSLGGMQRACVELDLMLARQAFGEQLGGVIPSLHDPHHEHENEGGRPAIDLRAARHPLLLLDGVEVVPNDIVLERGHALVVSGPNAGGKTVALKTLGVLALMAATGIALPCEGQPRIPVFSALITDVGDDQSIAANLSTFSAHVGHVRAALHAATDSGPGTLVLLDEVAVGTDPEQGAALAEAILVALVDAGATVVVTTHYDRLKLLATQPATSARFHNAAVGFDIARMRPTFRLSLGVPGSSSAIAVARRLGLPEAVLTRAEALLGDEGVKIDELLRDIEAERQSLARTRERLERDQLRLRQQDHEVRIRERRLLEGVRSRKAKAYMAAVEQLRALEVELKTKRKHLRRQDPEQVEQLPTRAQLAGEARSTLAKHRAQTEAEAASDQAAATELAGTVRVDPRTLAIGDRVRVLSMKQEGEVVALSGTPPKKVTVQLATLRTTVKVRDLSRPPPELGRRLGRKPGKATPILDFQAVVQAQAQAHFGEGAVAVKTSVDNVCDVRGQRYEDAQDRVSDFVAQALARDQDVVLIRHGHGGGAVRKAVRELLERHESVHRQRPGLPAEGGDAVTVAWLQ
ncbi:endonuclease MutS2 [Enhygromyxa salina]|uniref:Endonuclease MutS2 n=1 Tax=Enhygromyxa salina TaxID=215803 RepID=A0A2S9YS48_9BACT|nr:Smr/MutS family protein [Enhygromyxa salina]PRQ07916.1 Endonuclease MutS2 [Enhygromyxa salina]